MKQVVAPDGKRHPDILEVLSDLSNDQVFTPPRVAEAVLDLLPAEVWSDPGLRWLDPGCKTGVFPREITKRLMDGLVEHLPDEQQRLEHILKNMVFGIATEELTALISRRTLYCSKDATGEKSVVTMDGPDGHLWLERLEHDYVDGRCRECNASKELMEVPGRSNHAYALIHAEGRAKFAEEIDMKFDVIVGNPPYQMAGGGGGTNDTPLYDAFVEQAIALRPRYLCMIVPSRWMAGGRGLDAFRDMMLSSNHIRKLVDFPQSTDVFPTVDLKGGVCYFLWNRDNPGPCSSTLIRGADTGGPLERDLSEHDILVRDGRALSILNKVLSHEEESMEDLVSGDTPFGLASNFREYREDKQPRSGEVLLYAGATRQGAVDRSAITKNTHLIDEWKVLAPKAGPGNSGGHVIPDIVLGQPRVAAPPSACTQTYLTVGSVESEMEAEHLEAYLRTRFCRFLVSLRKSTQDAMSRVYRWAPQQDWSKPWTDDELFEKYEITTEEQAYIASMIREMPS